MSKKGQALGKAPTFDLGTSTTDINGIDINQKQQKTIKNDPQEETINKQVAEKYLEATKDLKTNTTKKHLKAGYTRHTFAVKDEHLLLMKALASYKRIEQKQLLEMLLTRAFNEIENKTKEEALNHYKTQNKKDLF